MDRSRTRAVTGPTSTGLAVQRKRVDTVREPCVHRGNVLSSTRLPRDHASPITITLLSREPAALGNVHTETKDVAHRGVRVALFASHSECPALFRSGHCAFRTAGAEVRNVHWARTCRAYVRAPQPSASSVCR